MSTLQVEIRCPRCGGDLERITQSRSGFGLRLVAKCVGEPGCRYEFIVNLDVFHARTDEDGEPTHCATEGGFMRHKRAGEGACELCKQAHVEAQQRRAANRKKATT